MNGQSAMATISMDCFGNVIDSCGKLYKLKMERKLRKELQPLALGSARTMKLDIVVVESD